MKFMLMIKGDQDYEAGLPPDPKLAEAIGIHSEILGPSYAGESEVRQMHEMPTG